MKRLTSLTFALCLAGSAVVAQSIEDSIVKQLQDQGFTRIQIERTFLGRLRVEAYSDTLERELVINPTTGKILRDYWEALDQDDDGRSPQLRDPHDDDDDDDDNGDDDDDDSDDDDEEDDDEEDDDEDDEDDDDDDDDDEDDE